MRRDQVGVLGAVGAFTIWGVLPVFWKALDFLPAAAIVAQRTLWSLPLLLPLIALRGHAPALARELRQPRQLAFLGGSAALLAFNWILYVWATLNERVIEAALGYYINPFVNIALGRLLLGERLSPRQALAVALAAAGVALQFPAVTGIPWVALGIGFSFSFYGLVKKRAKLDAIEGLGAETLLLAPIALGWLVATLPDLASAFGGSAPHAALVVATGLATATPLLLFGFAAKRIRLGTLGLLQFIGPTIQFLLGWRLYGEPMSPGRLASFALIWAAIALYVSATRAPRDPRPEDTPDPSRSR